jgi:hypothetical protein
MKKHLFLPMPIETVRSAWEEWRASNRDATQEVHLIEVRGGCFIVTEAGSKPPRVFFDLLKGFLESRSQRLARAS